MGGEGGRDGGRKVDACVRKAGVCAGGGRLSVCGRKVGVRVSVLYVCSIDV